MNIYKDLHSITEIALQHAKEHNCNYNIILFNPDENGKFCQHSTYEYVTDSFFEKERTNVIKLTDTNTLLERKKILDERDAFNYAIKSDLGYAYLNTYKDLEDNYTIKLTNHNLYKNGFNNTPKIKGKIVEVRTEPKIGNNELCSCNSGKKYKRCCKNKV